MILVTLTLVEQIKCRTKQRSVMYNNFECLSCEYFLCFNVYVTALLVLPPFYFKMFEIIPP